MVACHWQNQLHPGAVGTIPGIPSQGSHVGRARFLENCGMPQPATGNASPVEPEPWRNGDLLGCRCGWLLNRQWTKHVLMIMLDMTLKISI